MSDQDFYVWLRETITDRFSDGEVRTLCFDLGIDYENLGGSGKADKVRELLTHCLRHQLNQRLLERCQHTRPDIAWTVRERSNLFGASQGPTALVLREPVPDFVGREKEIGRLVQTLRSSPEGNAIAAISGVRGMGGVGKTELAYAVAQQLTDDYPDGQLLVELKGATTPLLPDLALQMILRAVGYTREFPTEITQLQNIYRSYLRGKRILILADDASDAIQVRPLIPPHGCGILITSRMRFTLPGMTQVDLRMLSPDDARKMLLGICPRIEDHADVLAKLCGYLPLALRVSASLLADDDTLRIEKYLARLSDERTKLSQLRSRNDPDLDVEASLRVSYEALDSVTRDVLCQCSIFDTSFDLVTAENVIEVRSEIEPILGDLRRRCLLEWDETSGHYNLHDLVRAFGAIQIGDVREVVWHRYLSWTMKRLDGTVDAAKKDNSDYVDHETSFVVKTETESNLTDYPSKPDKDRIREQYNRELQEQEMLWLEMEPLLRRRARRWQGYGIAPDIDSLAKTMFMHIIMALPRIRTEILFGDKKRSYLLLVAENGMRDEYRRLSRPNNQEVSIEALLYPEYAITEEEVSVTSESENDDEGEQEKPFDFINPDSDIHERTIMNRMECSAVMKDVRRYWFDNLSMADMQIVRSRWWVDPPMTFQKIADQLGGNWTGGSVRRRHSKILERTRSHLRDRGAIEEDRLPSE